MATSDAQVDLKPAGPGKTPLSQMSLGQLWVND